MKLGDKISPEDMLGTEYSNHSVLKLLEHLSDFYDSLSSTIMELSTAGALAILNLDTYAYSSIKGTLESIFIQHFSYIFSIHEHYMASTDYGERKDLGIEPEEDSQYWVAKIIKTNKLSSSGYKRLFSCFFQKLETYKLT